MNDIDKLAEYFMKFPGIGQRQAKRFVYFLLRKNSGFRQELSENINKLAQNIGQCKRCFRFFPQNGSDQCVLCRDIARDQSKLLILEKDSDFETLHSAGVYDGLYFILGGLMPISTKNRVSYLRIDDLMSRIQKEIQEKKLEEVILGLSLSPEGEHTRIFLQNELEKISGGKIKISILGRGLSSGTELEYSDSETLKNAIETRTEQ